ncbi:MAG: hypothetical protein ACT4PZ_19440 [Panacagrimonas sp.]
MWTRAQRQFAVQHKRELISHGFKAKVVPVFYTQPELVDAAR